MGANEKLLQSCFWRNDNFKEYGLFVLRFFKDCNLIYIIIDDRLPCKRKDSRLIFASCKDPNELWVPFIVIAYAKLHGCYKSLRGGYSHYALSDMTGYNSRLIVLKPGFTGYCEEYTLQQIWELLKRYKKWNCLMGCSIQSNPKDNHKVEAEAGLGLYYGHAYSLLDLNEIELTSEDKLKNLDNKLIKLRNPWGRGEWEGSFNDRSDEREKYSEEIKLKFQIKESNELINIDFNDGTFFMPFNEWYQHFTSLFIAISFPTHWSGQRCQGVWSGDVGGSRFMGTWLSNPKILLRLDSTKSKTKSTNDTNKTSNSNNKNDNDNDDYREVFIGIYIRDSRMTMGFEYFKVSY